MSKVTILMPIQFTLSAEEEERIFADKSQEYVDMISDLRKENDTLHKKLCQLAPPKKKAGRPKG